MNLNDAHIIEKVLADDKNAFKQFVESYQKLVAHIVFRMVPSVQDREDVCQEVFLKIYRNLAGFKYKSKLSTWVACIARNTALNHLEKKKVPAYSDLTPEEDTIEDVPSEIETPLGQIESADTSEIVRRELAKMPVKYREVLTLYHLDNMNYEEIAEITDLPPGTVKSHLFRGRKYLKDRLLSQYSKKELVK